MNSILHGKMDEVKNYERLQRLKESELKYRLRIKDLKEIVAACKFALRSELTKPEAKNGISMQLLVADDELECETIPGHNALLKQIAELEAKMTK